MATDTISHYAGDRSETEQVTARVVAVQDDLVKIEALPQPNGEPGALVKN